MELTPSAYDGLKRRASRLARRYSPLGIAPEGESLFHRALLRFQPNQMPTLTDRDHFFRSWSCAMQSALHDLYRSAKRGRTEPLDELAVRGDQSAVLLQRERVERLDALLANLAEMDGAAARIVHLRYFEELTWHEIAGQLGWSYGAVQRKWTSAKAWLRCQLKQGAPGLSGEQAGPAA